MAPKIEGKTSSNESSNEDGGTILPDFRDTYPPLVRGEGSAQCLPEFRGTQPPMYLLKGDEDIIQNLRGTHSTKSPPIGMGLWSASQYLS